MDCFEILEDEVFVDTMCHRVTYKGWNQVTSFLGSALFPNQRDVFHCYCCSSFCESAVHKRQGKARLWTCEQGDQILVPPQQALPVQFVLRVMPLGNMAQDGCYDGEQSRHVLTLAGYYWCSQNWLWNQWEGKPRGILTANEQMLPLHPKWFGLWCGYIFTVFYIFLHLTSCCALHSFEPPHDPRSSISQLAVKFQRFLRCPRKNFQLQTSIKHNQTLFPA